jgi:excisionase family DNA binding protein
MKVTPMGSEITEFFPEAARSDALSLTIRSRTFFKPTNAEDVEAGPSSSESTSQTSALNGHERDQEESPATPYLTELEAARVLDISVREVRRLVHEKRLGYIQLTKRKKVFTQTLIDEFIRRESGIREHQGLPGKGAAALPEQPRTTITVEESRALLKGLTKKS